MEKILFLIDSPGDLTQNQIEGKPIQILPISIIYNNKTYRDFYDVERTDFWNELDKMDEIPSTSLITPQAWASAYRDAQAQGYTHLVVLTVSSTASGTCNAAFVAKNLCENEPENNLTITVLDSRNYSYLYGNILMKGHDAYEQGKSYNEIISLMQSYINRQHGLLWVYSLKHLKKSGRISGMAAFVGEALGVRPVLLIRDGVIAPVERVRGDKNLIPKMIEHAKKLCVDSQEQDMYLLFSDVPEEEIIRAEQCIIQTLNPRSLVRQPIGSVISINCGPKSMALCFLGESIK